MALSLVAGRGKKNKATTRRGWGPPSGCHPGTAPDTSPPKEEKAAETATGLALGRGSKGRSTAIECKAGP